METPTTFPLFSYLPAELRYQIWQDALPSDSSPGILFPFNPGCWESRYILYPGQENDIDLEYADIIIEFNPNRLNPVPVAVPLLLVSHEANYIARTWIRKKDLKVKFCQDRQTHIFNRLFDPKRDTLYISEYTFTDFCGDPYEVPDPNTADLGLAGGQEPPCLAVSEGLVKSRSQFLLDICDTFFRFALVVVVLGVPDEISAEDQWELEIFKQRSVSLTTIQTDGNSTGRRVGSVVIKSSITRF
ncbi:hypothetical protein BO71DRAFT_440708 [Aspergillus ellipticus CBS 707.79]|uniref:2EXR domain-containing protein n=1 Tax=Aspergillus ellipticus CBS 707.79 TaxID=1448320 RepID=A0A319E2P0_9EURO|nr:hypothetical protein BO71DRAFT_440708 [Aspergillus ellipticus CBS 707.79]